MRAWVLLSAVFMTVVAGSAGAGTPPRVDMATDVIAPYVPQGWKNSALTGGPGGAELAEFTPTGQPSENFTDLVGYTRTPIQPGATIRPDIDFGASMKARAGAKCSAVTIRELKPVGAPAGWRFVQQFCVLNSGPSAGRIDITFDAFAVRRAALFSIWRAWRGTPDEFRRFLVQTGKVEVDALVTRDGAADFNESVVDRIAPLILKAWTNTFTKAELCDLGVGEICPSFRASTQALPPNVIASLSLTGSHELTAIQALELQAKMPGQKGDFARETLAKLNSDTRPTKNIVFVQSIALSNHDWTAPSSMVAAVTSPLLGSRSDGGSLVAIDETPPADPATRARMQAYIVAAAHILWRLGVMPDRETITLAPPS